MGSIPQPTANAQPPVVVLGAGVRPGGRPSQTLQRRVLHGIRCFREHNAAALIFTGGRGRHPPSEARVMQAVACSHGIDPGQMVLEESSRSTLDSAEACADIIRSAGWRQAWIVTDRYHLPRSLFLFQCFGIRAQGSAPAVSATASGGWHWRWMILRECLAVPWNLLRLVPRIARRRIRLRTFI
ncbi:MAG TPA: YdcF family protein [Desulfobacterales bacterium]